MRCRKSDGLEVLSRPQLMALDGQPGYVQVGQNVPPHRARTNIDPLGGQTNSITYEAVGLILQVVPRISPDGLVVMQITANKSEVGPEADGIPISVSNNGQVLPAPRIDITQALTTVSALSGQTVVLGGLLANAQVRCPPPRADHLRHPAGRRPVPLRQRFRGTPRAAHHPHAANHLQQDGFGPREANRIVAHELDSFGDVINLHGEAGLRSRCDRVVRRRNGIDLPEHRTARKACCRFRGHPPTVGPSCGPEFSRSGSELPAPDPPLNDERHTTAIGQGSPSPPEPVNEPRHGRRHAANGVQRGLPIRNRSCKHRQRPPANDHNAPSVTRSMDMISDAPSRASKFVSFALQPPRRSATPAARR